MQLKNVSVLSSKVYLLIKGKVYVYSKTLEREYGQYDIKAVVCQYGRTYLELDVM